MTGGGLGWPVHGGWRALAAVKSSARPLGVIGDEQVCARLVTERRILRARAILSYATRERRTELTGEGRDDGAELDWARGREVEWLRPGVVEQGARGGPFIGGRGGGRKGGRRAPTSSP